MVPESRSKILGNFQQTKEKMVISFSIYLSQNKMLVNSITEIILFLYNKIDFLLFFMTFVSVLFMN